MASSGRAIRIALITALFIRTSCFINLKHSSISYRSSNFLGAEMPNTAIISPAGTPPYPNALRMSEDYEGGMGERYSQRQILKAETEAPFRKVRVFLYFSLMAAAGIGSLIGITKLIASSTMGGLSQENLNDQYFNLAVNLLGIPAMAFLWKSENDKQNLLLQRIKKGGDLAGLKLRYDGFAAPGGAPAATVLKLSDLRGGRGIDKRVVIVVAREDLLRSSMQSCINQEESLTQNDLFIVPLVIKSESVEGGFTLSSVDLSRLTSREGDDSRSVSSTPRTFTHIGTPVGVSVWNEVIKMEIEGALKQQPEALDRGITIIIKKNGRVGTRRFGVPIWEALVDDVSSRSDLGLDVRNI